MKMNTAKLSLLVVTLFVINVLAIPALTTKGMAAAAAAGAAKAGWTGCRKCPSRSLRRSTIIVGYFFDQREGGRNIVVGDGAGFNIA